MIVMHVVRKFDNLRMVGDGGLGGGGGLMSKMWTSTRIFEKG